MTPSADRIEPAPTATLMTRRGAAPDPSFRKAAASAASAAPPATAIAPPSPLAVPASSGRTLIIPALALGSSMPVPSPMNATEPKHTSALSRPARSAISASARGRVQMTEPASIIRLSPSRVDQRAEMKFPSA